jgi:TonB family protein
MTRSDAGGMFVSIAAAFLIASSPGPASTAQSPAAVASPLPAPVASPSPPVLTLGGVNIGQSILEVVRWIGPPDVVRTTDVGHEWQWVDEGGLDREILTDDDMIVRQVLVAEPASLPGSKPPPIVQPAEFAALGVTATDAGVAVAKAGGESIAEPDPTIRAWALSGGVVVAELESGRVGQLLALDDLSARHLGYLTPPPGAALPLVRRAPVMIKEFVTPYPDSAARTGMEGTVVVRVVVGPDGGVERADVVVSAHNDEIDAASVQSAKKSTYRPAQCDGTPCRGVYFDLQSWTLIQ